MKKFLKHLAAVSLLSLSFASHAVLIDASTEIPDENVLMNFNGSGIDWVYAGPIAPNEFGPGSIQTPDYRASEGWRYATAFEWATRPDWTDFIIGNNIVPANSGFSDHTVYRFASEYWGDFRHVDLNDAAAGRITNGFDIGSLTAVFETWFVRDSRSVQVSEPSLLALIGLSAFFLMRRKPRA